MDLQPNSEASPNEFSAKDLCRLKTNDPRLANRFIKIKDIYHPILHLSILDIDIFRVLTEFLDELFSALSDDNFFVFLESESARIISFLQKEVPEAAAIVLRKSVAECKKLADPITLFRVVIRQWLHNLEIDKVQTAFPMPEDGQPDVHLHGCPENNPMSLDERLCSNYHWTLEQAQKITYAQAYLLSNESAWGYEKAKAKSEIDTPTRTSRRIEPAPKKVGAKRFIENFGDTPQEQAKNYREYMANMGFDSRDKKFGN